MNDLKDKVALVTGAATGIGRATAIKLAAHGAKVVAADINETATKETLRIITDAGGSGRFMQLDVSKPDQVTAVMESIMATEGQLDMAVNNAGIGGVMAPIHEVKLDDWQRMMDINLSGVFYCLQGEVRCMLPKGGGKIVNVASLAGLNGVPGGSPYAAAKHAVIGLSKSAAVEYGNYGIRCNSVCPGFIETPIIDGLPESFLDKYTQHRVPMKRLGQPEEVADTIYWLLSDQSSFINGHSLMIDGGMMAN